MCDGVKETLIPSTDMDYEFCCRRLPSSSNDGESQVGLPTISESTNPKLTCIQGVYRAAINSELEPFHV